MANEVQSRAFKSGNSIAVRLPKQFGVKENAELTVRKVGQLIVLDLRPRKPDWRDALERLRTLPKPSKMGVRERIEFPERPGL